MYPKSGEQFSGRWACSSAITYFSQFRLRCRIRIPWHMPMYGHSAQTHAVQRTKHLLSCPAKVGKICASIVAKHLFTSFGAFRSSSRVLFFSQSVVISFRTMKIFSTIWCRCEYLPMSLWVLPTYCHLNGPCPRQIDSHVHKSSQVLNDSFSVSFGKACYTMSIRQSPFFSCSPTVWAHYQVFTQCGAAWALNNLSLAGTHTCLSAHHQSLVEALFIQ